MKTVVLILLIAISSFARTTNSDCYQQLLKGDIDSATHQVNVSHLIRDTSLKAMALLGISEVLRKAECKPQYLRVQCGRAIKENALTDMCYAETKWGYFLVNKDYLDNLNVIFNRWD